MRPVGGDAPADDAALMGYVKVYGFMGSALELSGVELNVFARIFGFTVCGRSFYESRANTAAFFGISRRAVITAVGRLESRGLIAEDLSDDGEHGGNTKSYAANMELVANALGIGVEDLKAACVGRSEDASPESLSFSEESSPPGSDEASPGQVKNLHPIPKRKEN